MRAKLRVSLRGANLYPCIMTSTTRAFLICCALLCLCGLIFSAFPEWDLAFSAVFFHDGHFYDQSHISKILRLIGLWVPLIVLFSSIGLSALGRCGFIKAKLTGRLCAFLVLTMALGPGLLVNVVLKDHSHRPRPYIISQFGGPMDFVPWYRFDGGCDHNCSFVSGETASAVWLIAPALLLPSPVQPVAFVAAGLFATGVSLLRIAYGAHFISDVLFSALLSLMIILLGWHWARPPPKEHNHNLG